MILSAFTTQTKTVQGDPLMVVLEQLQHIAVEELSLPKRERAGLLWLLLVRLERQLRQRLQLRDATDVMADSADICPKLQRQHERLRQGYRNALERTMALKWQAYRVVEFFQASSDPVGWVHIFMKKAGKPPAPNFRQLREASHDLQSDLQRMWREETDMLLESVTSDVGVGD